ncbi:MAG TPA: SDR family oxidoreductase [Thermoanaerobaculia bacterium]|nr:SDR family oxidoreductase [Thermoanaerobaculia bacterium]
MSIFFTGFPGFLGSELLPRVLARTDDDALCLVQPKFRALAEQRIPPALAPRVKLVDGDITESLDHIDATNIREAWHLAAVYDLAVPRDVGMRVNVIGTRRVLDLAARAPRFERLHYVSTCYVSGRYDGVFREDDLENAGAFNNYYEETKQLAEVAVRKSGVPSTIYRPSVVVGDSATGATQKFDGPYFVLQWLMRQPRIAMLPVVGRPSRYRFNVVPRDFVMNAIEYLSAHPRSEGKTYAIADPSPLTVDETIDVLAEAGGRKVLRVPLTKSIAKDALQYVPGMYRLLRIPPAAVDYFVHPTLYNTSNATADLAGSGIAAPRLADYMPKLVEFWRAHREIGSAAMT